MLSYRLLLLRTLLFLLTVSAACAQPSKALTLNQQGLDAAARRDYAAAERDGRAAVEIYRSLGSPYEAHLSIALFNLGQAMCGEGRWRASEEIFSESLDLSRRALGPRHIRTVAGLNALGHVEMMLGGFESAEARFLEALALARAFYPRDLQLAYALAGFSSLRLRAGKLEEALPYAEEALRVTIEAEPREGVETATMYQNVAQIHRTAGRPERALPLLRKALAIYEQAGESGSPRYASALSEEGLALMDDGKLVQADREMKRAVALLAECPGCGFQLAIARNNLGLLRFRQRKYAEADELLRRALAEEELYSPTDAAQIAMTRNALQKVRAAM